jgi:hypothetical protein
LEATHDEFIALDTDLAHQAQISTINSDRIEGINLMSNATSDYEIHPEIHVRTFLEEESEKDEAVGTQLRQLENSSQNPLAEVYQVSGPGHLLLPERDASLMQIASTSPFMWTKAFDAHQCACLMHFFIEKVAPNVQSYPSRNFSTMVYSSDILG